MKKLTIADLRAVSPLNLSAIDVLVGMIRRQMKEKPPKRRTPKRFGDRSNTTAAYRDGYRRGLEDALSLASDSREVLAWVQWAADQGATKPAPEGGS